MYSFNLGWRSFILGMLRARRDTHPLFHLMTTWSKAGICQHFQASGIPRYFFSNLKVPNLILTSLKFLFFNHKWGRLTCGLFTLNLFREEDPELSGRTGVWHAKDSQFKSPASPVQREGVLWWVGYLETYWGVWTPPPNGSVVCRMNCQNHQLYALTTWVPLHCEMKKVENHWIRLLTINIIDTDQGVPFLAIRVKGKSYCH